MKLVDFLKKRHQHKVNENKRFELLHLFRSSQPIPWENPFVKLNELVKHQKDLPTEKKKFEELGRTTEKIKKLPKIITFNKINNIKDWSHKTIIQKLREISKIK